MKSKSNIRFTVNGESKTVSLVEDMPLLWVLRDTLGFHGTKFGCGIGQCGACTVHLNGSPTRSCITPISAVSGQDIVTIEGFARNVNHPIQKAWIELDVPQCGYCQAGQILTAAALLEQQPQPSDADIDQAMSGNICRCGTYPNIRAAIHLAAECLKQEELT